MPFVKTGTNTYRSPSGRKFTAKQVKMYYATDGFTKKKYIPPTKREMIKEHKELVPILKSGNKAGLRKETREQGKELKSLMKSKLVVNNKLKGAYGRMNPRTNKIEINIKAHKNKGKVDKAELASTIKHEVMHVKHPKMTEKEVYKRTRKTKMSPEEQKKYLSKLQNYKVGAMKRKLKLPSKSSPTEMIKKMNEMKLGENKLLALGKIK